MGGLCSTFSAFDTSSAEDWQAPAKWQQPDGVIHAQTDTTAVAYHPQTPSPPRHYANYLEREVGSPVSDLSAAQRGSAYAEANGPPVLSAIEAEERADQFSEGRQRPQAPLNWNRGELIGAGAFGRVYLGLDNDNGQLMAVKQVSIPSKGEGAGGRVVQHVRELEKEVEVLKQLDHPNIVRYLGTDRTESTLNIFLEFVPGGSIASLLSKFGSFKEAVIKRYARQILLGLEYLHGHKIMHRDIKGANILVDNCGLVKLADFGASKQIEDLVTIDSGVKSIKGTSYWMAPEVIKQTGHGRMADIWSVGCTIIEMATGKPPWSQFSSQVSAMFHIASSKGPPPIPEHLSAEARDFLLLCFNRVPMERPNATRLLLHPFLADVAPKGASTPLANLTLQRLPHGAQSPIAEEPERSSKRPRSSGQPPTRLSSGNSDFLKLYSPMADRLAEAEAEAEAEASSRPAPAPSGAANGIPPAANTEGMGAGALEDLLGDLPTIDGAVRNSVASRASLRYDGSEDADRVSKSPASSTQSDYNPVEEPSWLRYDSLIGTSGLASSPTDSPRIRATFSAASLEESTAVASPMRGSKRPPSRGAQPGGEESFDDILDFVKEKAQKDTLRLSKPFGKGSLSMISSSQRFTMHANTQFVPSGTPLTPTKEAKWEEELHEELARQRPQPRSVRSWMPENESAGIY